MSGTADNNAGPPPRLGPIANALHGKPDFRAIIEGLGEAALADLEASLEWYGISGGSVLFQQGDAARDTFVLISGRLGVFLDAGLGTRLITQVKPGELIGELALVSGEPRSATVVALRDSEIVRLPQEATERLMASSPHLMLHLIRLLAGRLQRAHRPPLRQATKAIAVVPVDDDILGRDFGEALLQAFSSPRARAGLIDSASGHLTAEEMSRFEEHHDLALYLADRRGSPWTRRCVRQADRVLFVADAAFLPDEPADQEISGDRHLHGVTDLMLINPSGATAPDGAQKWLGRFSADRIYHVRRGNAADYARVARLTTGRAVGLVLSGGGARGFAHVGALRAFETAGIPIDLVGGTSMGALVGSGPALGFDSNETGRRLRYGFVDINPVNDYTLPLISLARGRKMSHLLRDQCAGSTVENLWKTFFCVSANLSTGKIAVHQRGPLWQALRASAAIPGIVPPYIEGNQVFVDGGIMNNFPADVMSSLARGPVVGIEVTAGTQFISKADAIEEKSLLWRMRNYRDTVPSIVGLLVRSGTINSEVQTAVSRSKVDLLIQPRLEGIDMLSFDSFDKAVELGYQATMEALERLETPLVA
jgi:NTE family protein